MKGLTRNKTVDAVPAESKDKDKSKPPITSLKGNKNRSTVDMTELTRDSSHIRNVSR